METSLCWVVDPWISKFLFNETSFNTDSFAFMETSLCWSVDPWISKFLFKETLFNTDSFAFMETSFDTDSFAFMDTSPSKTVFSLTYIFLLNEASPFIFIAPLNDRSSALTTS